MDLQASLPYASSSSFPSHSQFQMGTDPLLAFEKLQDFCQVGPPHSAHAFPKFPFPTFSSPAGSFGFGFDHSSEHCPVTWGASAPHEGVRSSPGTYITPNKIAYRIPGTSGLTNSSPDPPVPSPSTSAASALQGILLKYGIGSARGPDQQQTKIQQEVPAHPVISNPRITHKIRNLDEILRNLDHQSMSKRFSITGRKEITDSIMKKHLWPEPVVPMVHMEDCEQPTGSAEHSSESLGGSVIPDGITHINKSISRMQFKSQMEKLTGCIEDRWPGSKRLETTAVVEKSPFIPEPTSIGSMQTQPNTNNELPPASAPVNASSSSSTSTNLLEEMLRNVAGLERRLAKRDRLKHSKQKGFLARGKLWVQRPAGKKMAAMLQKQFRQHAASISQRLDRTDLAIRSLKRHRRDASSPLYMEENCRAQGKERRISRVSHSSNNVQNCSSNNSRDMSSTALEKNLEESNQPSVAEKCIEACEALSSNMQLIQDQLCTLQSDSQQMGDSLEKIQKQTSEQSMEIELCWTAINHLCIDNETFREELQVYQTDLQHLPSQGPASTFHEGLQVCGTGLQQAPTLAQASGRDSQTQDETQMSRGWKVTEMR